MLANDCILERLAEHHDVATFTCGNAELDTWLTRFAAHNDGMDSSRVFVLVEEKEVVGYLALTMGAVERSDPPPKLVRGLPHGYPVGAVVLARLAIRSDVQRGGYGSRLLAEAISLAVRASKSVAARLLIVDAIDDDAAAFYRQRGFVDLPEHPRRLYVRLSVAEASMREAGIVESET